MVFQENVSEHSIPPEPRLAAAWAHAPVNPLTAAVAARRARGGPFIDLVGASPHENGLGFPREEAESLAREAVIRALIYRPHARGQQEAREAIAGYYDRRGLPTRPDQLVLTPGTSLGYFYALRLLCEPGDEILVPSPGYPLFDDLCRIAGVGHRYYHYVPRPGPGGVRWTLDLEDLAFQVTPRTRAIAVVSPHNPLGTVLSSDELREVGRICRARGLALVFDEVFCEFTDSAPCPFPRPRGEDFPLVLVLNGFSKMLSLPGFKLAWIRADGDAARVGRFLSALEYAGDLFLPVSEITQAMVPGLVEAGEQGVLARLRDEYARRRTLVGGLLGPWVLPADGGVYACGPLADLVERLGRGRRRLDRSGWHADDDELALRVLDEADVLVHPGHFYDLPGHFVMTCSAAPADLREGCARLVRWLEGSPGS